MYHLDVSPFGEFEKFELHNPATDNGFVLVPHFGACVLDICFAGQSVIDGYSTPEEMRINKWGKNVLLYPFPNRLKDGRYEWQGMTHQFPVNDRDTGNALHGFGMDKEMRVEEIEVAKDFAEVTCLYTSRGEEAGYPFPFTFAVTFRMEDAQTFEAEIVFKNDGNTAIPVGFGWHPYFRLSDSADRMELQLPPCAIIEVDDRMIPTGNRQTFERFSDLTPIGTMVLDNCFALSAEKGKAQLLLRGERGTLHYWQETGAGKFDFLQLFTPPHRRSLAVEPMSCNINAFNNGEGLITLEPGADAYARFGFSWEALR